MSSKTKEQYLPVEMHDTVRRKLLSALEQGPRSAKELSAEVKISEKEVSSHLEHIRKTMNKSGRRLVIITARCKKCGFVFSKRERLTKPGKCPLCKGESLYEPLFSIEEG